VTNSLFVLVYTPRQKEDNKTFAFFGKKRKKVQKDGDEEMEKKRKTKEQQVTNRKRDILVSFCIYDVP
jgi:hypothetical protein